MTIKRRNVLLTMLGALAAGVTGVARALGAWRPVDSIQPVSPGVGPEQQLFDDVVMQFEEGLHDPRDRRMANRRRAIRDMQDGRGVYPSRRPKVLNIRQRA